MMKKGLIIFCISFIFSDMIWAQDPNFSQFYNCPTYYNPAMNSIGNGITFRCNSRFLWTPIPGSFNTYTVALEAEAINKTSLGVLAMSDVAGEAYLRTTGGYILYTYRPLETRNNLLQFGVSGGLINKNIDKSKFLFSDQLDEVYGNTKTSAYNIPNNSVTYPDFSAGTVYRHSGEKNKKHVKHMETLGFSFHHLTRPKDAFISDEGRLPVKGVVHGNVQILVNNKIFSPSFIFEKQGDIQYLLKKQSGFQTFTLGLEIINRPFTFGVWYRNKSYTSKLNQYDSFIFSLGLNITKNNQTHFKINYSFDSTISRLKTASYGSHEISLVIDLNGKVLFKGSQSKKKDAKMHECPTNLM
jgi:type IX secretion system PorP/SprF family membrane protein